MRRFVLERDTSAALAIWRETLDAPVTPLGVQLQLPEPARRINPADARGPNAVAIGLTRLGRTFHELRHYRQAVLMLMASVCSVLYFKFKRSGWL